MSINWYERLSCDEFITVMGTQYTLEDIYDRLNSIQVKLSEVTEANSTEYVISKSVEISEHMSTLAQFFTRVSQHRRRLYSQSQLFELFRQESFRTALLDPRVQSMSAAAVDRQAKAVSLADEWFKNIQQDYLGCSEDALPEELHSMERCGHYLQCKYEDWDTLLNVLREKQAWLKLVDSDLRLQCKSLEMSRPLQPRGRSAVSNGAADSKPLKGDWRKELESHLE